MIGSVTATALALALAPSPALALTADTIENISTIVTAEQPGFDPSPRSLPGVESTLGRGAALSSDPAARLHIPGIATGQRSALVRVTVTDPESPVTVLTGTLGSPVLLANAGTTASATTLLPVRDGAISLWADQPAAARIEVLAQFTHTPDAPGATIALDTPVTRADTAVGLSGSALTTDPLWIGLTGEGNVPATQVRSVYITLDISVPTATELDLGTDQTMPLAAGRSVITTVVEPDTRGGVVAGLTGGAQGSLRADVIGWVPEAPADLSRANTTGSYVASTERDVATVEVGAQLPSAKIHASDHGDVEYALALVSATTPTPTSGSGSGSGAGIQTTRESPPETSTIDWSARPLGRAQGIAVDALAGAHPQLALVPVEAQHTRLTIRRGAAEVRVHPLGAFLSEPVPPGDSGTSATVSFTSPNDARTVDVSDTGSFTLAGTATAGANAIDRIEISSPGVGFIGTAELNYGNDAITWSFSAAAPNDGEFDYIATVFDRGDPKTGASADRIRLTVDTPDAHNTVVAPEAKVFNEDPAQPDFTLVDERRIAFTAPPSIEPGDIVLSDNTPGTPEGFLGRVSAINQVAGLWVVDTTEVALDELFRQVDVDGSFEFEDGVGVEVTDLPAETSDPTALMSATYAVADESGQFGPDITADAFEVAPSAPGANAELNVGDEVDLDLDVSDFDVDPSQFELRCREPGTDTQEPTGASIDENGEWVAPAAGTPIAGTCTDSPNLNAGMHRTWSFGVDANLLIALENGKLNFRNQTGDAPAEQEKQRRSKLATKAAIAIQAAGQVSVTLDISLDVSFQFKWKVIPTGVTVNDFTVQFTSDLKAQAAAQIYFETKYRFNLRQEIARINLPTITFTVGPVPIVITNALKTSIGISAEMKAMATVPMIGITRVDIFGFRYSSKSGLERIKNDPKTTYPNPIFTPLGDATTLSLAGLLAVGPEVSYESKIYGFAGPELTLYGRAGVEGEATAHPSDLRAIEAKIAVFIDAGLLGEAKLKLIRWKILEITVFNLNWRYTLYAKEWSFRI